MSLSIITRSHRDLSHLRVVVQFEIATTKDAVKMSAFVAAWIQWAIEDSPDSHRGLTDAGLRESPMPFLAMPRSRLSTTMDIFSPRRGEPPERCNTPRSFIR